MFPSHLMARPPGHRRSRPRRARRSRGAEAAVLIRAASPADARALDRLAVLDDRTLPPGERLVGEVDGRVVAAVDVASGAAIADPFVPTDSLVELLGVRAAQVRR